MEHSYKPTMIGSRSAHEWSVEMEVYAGAASIERRSQEVYIYSPMLFSAYKPTYQTHTHVAKPNRKEVV